MDDHKKCIDNVWFISQEWIIQLIFMYIFKLLSRVNMTSASYTARTAEPDEYANALEVLIAAFDGDSDMMAVIAGGSRR